MLRRLGKYFSGAWHPYEYRDTHASKLGAGVSDLSLVRPQSLLMSGIAGPRYNVQGQLNVQAPAFVKQQQQLIPLSMIGNGLGTFTGVQLQPLGNPPTVRQG